MNFDWPVQVMCSPHVAMKQINIIGQPYLCTHSCGTGLGPVIGSSLEQRGVEDEQLVPRRRRVFVVLRRYMERQN